MTTWLDMARDNRSAAHEVFLNGRWRTCACRAYYAAYALATHHLVNAHVQMPQDRGNPAHVRLPLLVSARLHQFSHAVRGKLDWQIRRLYVLRLMADYKPNVTVDRHEAREAIGLMRQIIADMGGI